MAPDDRDLPRLTAVEYEQIRPALRAWANAHPNPDDPVIMLLNGSALTPLDIADAIDNLDSPSGRTLSRMFAVALHHPTGALPLDEIISDFERDVAEWNGMHA